MNDIRQGLRAGRSWGLVLTLLCVLMVVVSGTVQVAHSHADGANTHADCSLCAAAHITVHLAETPAAAPAAAVAAVPEALPPALLPSSLCTFALFTRPPPASVVPA